ncbi:MAG: NAD(P)-dependent oxidoreductase, partial [Proteobacteria bacterium]|nr:NAD(P)-dependent oxidoreductase [Pseudomonadota bacterium]
MRRVLIAGGSGQIGSALISSAPPEYEIYAPNSSRLDIRDAESVANTFARFQPELVINAAAYTAVDKAETERELAFAINAAGAGHLARSCQVQQTPLLHVSTDYVFDGANASGYHEDDQPNPLNVYGASKLEGERQVIDAGTPYLILRVSWVFSSVGTNFVKTML